MDHPSALSPGALGCDMEIAVAARRMDGAKPIIFVEWNVDDGHRFAPPILRAARSELSEDASSEAQ